MIRSIRAYAARSARGKLEPFTYDPGPLGPDEVEVAVTHCSICHTDQSLVDDEWGMSAYPLVPGHEVIGTVAATGPGVRGFSIGQRVGVGWQCGSCGACEYCRSGRQQLCQDERDTIVRHHGGFAERVRADAGFVLPIPDGLEAGETAPLLCAGAAVFTPMLRHGAGAGTRAAVVGIGGLGHLALQFLVQLGCEVTAISSTHSKDEEARALGAHRVLATKATSELREAGRSYDLIFCTVAAELPWLDYLRALRPQGKIVLLGVPASNLSLPALPFVFGELAVVGGRGGSPAEVSATLEFAARHGIRAQVERFPMAEVNAAMDRLRSGQARYRVVLEA